MQAKQKAKIFSHAKGFTLLELLIVIALIAVISTLGLLVGMDFYRTYAFSYERQVVVSALEKARNQALSNINQARHGVYFAGGNYVIFQGLTYASRNMAFDQVISASPALSHSGMQEVVFSQLSGDAVVTGSPLQLSDGLTHNVTISINSEGQINW